MSENTEDIKAILRKHGWQEEQATAEKSGGEPSTAEKTEGAPQENQTFQIPEDLMDKLTPAEKERVRNTAGHPFQTPGERPPNKDPWKRYVDELGTVEVTELELQEYTRALLFDERFQLPVRLPIGEQTAEIVVRSLTVSEREVMALALNQIAASYPVASLQNAALIADYFLKMSLLVQVVSFNGQPCMAYDASTAPGELPEKSPKVSELAQLARTEFANYNQGRLRLMIRALHLFETKQTILEDSYFNRDFPRPAGAA